MGKWFVTAIAALPIIVASIAMEAADLKPESRMAIVRGLTAEYATLKAPLPRGKKGLVLSAVGSVDQDSLRDEISHNGTALTPLTLVQITAVEIANKQIAFEINGGGKKKSKWYEHIEIGMGSRSTPISNPNEKNQTATGSSIILKFPKEIPEGMTVAELKNILAPVLDFNPVSPIQALTRPIPPKFKEAVEAQRAEPGMDREMVVAALGPPQRKVREDKDGIEHEDWIYGTPPLKTIFVTFEGDEVVDVKEYTGGVGGSVNINTEELPR